MLQLKKAFKVCEWRSGFFERNHGSTTEYRVQNGIYKKVYSNIVKTLLEQVKKEL